LRWAQADFVEPPGQRLLIKLNSVLGLNTDLVALFPAFAVGAGYGTPPPAQAPVEVSYQGMPSAHISIAYGD